MRNNWLKTCGITIALRRPMLRSAVFLSFVLGIALCNIACAQKTSQPGTKRPMDAVKQDQTGSIAVGNRTRTYLVRLPKDYDPQKRYPLMLAFHALLGTGEVQQRQSKMNAAADRHGFIVVYPDGTGLFPNRLAWNAGTCCASAVRDNVDDVGFVRALLDTLPKSYAIDEQRVYATGMSNGGMLCYRLACEMPERFAAIAPVAADLGVDGPIPKRGVPIIDFHGLKDTFKPYQGGTGKVLGVKHRSIPDTIAWWVKANNCDTQPAEVIKEKDFVLTKYRPQAGQEGAPIDFYLLPDGGHTWPGGEDVSAALGTGKLIESVDASELILKFCQSYTLPAVPVKK